MLVLPCQHPTAHPGVLPVSASGLNAVRARRVMRCGALTVPSSPANSSSSGELQCSAPNTPSYPRPEATFDWSFQADRCSAATSTTALQAAALRLVPATAEHVLPAEPPAPKDGHASQEGCLVAQGCEAGRSGGGRAVPAGGVWEGAAARRAASAVGCVRDPHGWGTLDQVDVVVLVDVLGVIPGRRLTRLPCLRALCTSAGKGAALKEMLWYMACIVGASVAQDAAVACQMRQLHDVDARAGAGIQMTTLCQIWNEVQSIDGCWRPLLRLLNAIDCTLWQGLCLEMDIHGLPYAGPSYCVLCTRVA